MDLIINFFQGIPKPTGFVLLIILGLLVTASTTFFIWNKIKPEKDLSELTSRTNSWWVIFSLFFIVVFIKREISYIGMGMLSFIAFRELISNLSLDHHVRKTLFWCYLAIPVQFYAAYIGWYGFFIIFIPVIAFMLIPLRTIITGIVKDITKNFAIIQWSMMITIFSISHIAFMLSFPEKEGFEAGNSGLILYLIFLTQFNDVLQYIWGKMLGKRKIAPKVSPNKTLEGFLGGLVSIIILAYFLRFLTPFTEVQSLITGALIASAGFIGDLTISAIKRDLEIKDMGNLIPGHGGAMDRIDSLSFTSLVFFHLTYYWHY